MFIDFIVQLFFTSIFFLGIAGIGVFLLHLFRWKFGNDALTISLAYFVSLCFFTFSVVALLFIVPDKLGLLLTYSLLYGMVSLFFLIFSVRKGWLLEGWKESSFWKNKKQVWFHSGAIALIIGVTFLFFLQAYHTSILDEWLHRPIVKAFTENGAFPLVNPLDPTSNFIQTYHYGTQIVASAFQLIARLGVSESLDLVKFCTFIGIFFLFYGMIFQWTQKKWLSLVGAITVLFCGSSFFFIDSFTISHLHRMKGIEQIWPINAPLSYMLMAITGVGTPMAIAFMVLIESVFYRKRNFSVVAMLLFGLLLVGFFILNEFFALIMTGCFGLIILYNIFIQRSGWKRTCRIILLSTLFFTGVLYGVYKTGGVMGDLVAKEANILRPSNIITLIKRPVTDPSEKGINSSVDANTPVTSLLSLRPISKWGFPAEKKTLVIWNYPIPYLRSILLETGIFVLLGLAFYRRKIYFSEQPVFWILMVSSLLVPFIFSSSWWDINLAKTTALGFVLVHLSFFYLLGKMNITKSILVIFGVFFVFGVLPAMLMGPNIQWQWISNKGKSQYCSQNPLCYNNKTTEFLQKFEQKYPGLKRVVVSGDTEKVVDLSNSYVYSKSSVLTNKLFRMGNIDYIFDTAESCKKESVLLTETIFDKYPVVLIDEKYCIRMFEK